MSDEELKHDIRQGASLELIHFATGIDMLHLICLESQVIGELGEENI